MWELTKTFRFEAAHTLQREVAAEASRRVHGHSYRAVVTIRGAPDPQTGMVVDLAVLDRALAAVRDMLDHRLLDDVQHLGAATLENLAAYVWRALAGLDGLARVTVHRDSLDESCSYVG